MTDPKVVLRVVTFLGSVLLALVVGLIVLAVRGKTIPDVLLAGLVTLASTSLGTLGALLVSTRSGPPAPPGEPVPVTVTDQPIATQDVPADVPPTG